VSIVHNMDVQFQRHAVNQDCITWYGRHVVRRRRRRWAHAPANHAASQVDHEKRVAWVSICMHARGSVPIVMVLR